MQEELVTVLLAVAVALAAVRTVVKRIQEFLSVDIEFELESLDEDAKNAKESLQKL